MTRLDAACILGFAALAGALTIVVKIAHFAGRAIGFTYERFSQQRSQK